MVDYPLRRLNSLRDDPYQVFLYLFYRLLAVYREVLAAIRDCCSRKNAAAYRCTTGERRNSRRNARILCKDCYRISNKTFV